MSDNKLQKSRERLLLESFLDVMCISKEFIEERESPDFLIQFEGRKIGVELTDLFVNMRQTTGGKFLTQAQESISRKIINQSQKLYQQDILSTPVRVSIGFLDDLRVLDRNCDEEAKFIAEFVRDLRLFNGEYFEFNPDEIEHSPLPEEITFLHALGVPEFAMASWDVVDAGIPMPISVELLQERIEDKSKKLKEYQKVVSENWLVITGNNFKFSQMFKITSEFDPTLISSPFSKTFYFSGTAIVKLGSNAKESD
ncbi:MAG: hypothetical protein PHW04_02370 [Candidatus Wallbacteria bacterium]|nr:hypothetical protein [Candidatus Wallbacteria bacterium]